MSPRRNTNPVKGAARSILVADGDAVRGRALADALEDDGHKVVRATHGVEALERALASGSRLVIAAHGLPLVDAPRLAEITRSNPRTRGARFLFLGEPETPGFERGLGDQQLPATLRIEDIVEVAREMLAQQEWISDFDAATRKGETGSGTLDQLSLADLVQLLHVGGKTGCLEVEHDDPSFGCLDAAIWFRDGEVTAARAGAAEGEKALFRMLGWESGLFRFGPGRCETPARVLAPTRRLLAEGVRQVGEWTRLATQLPPADARIRLKVNSTELPASVHPLTHEVLVLLDIYDRVGDIVDHASYPDYQVLRTLHTLAERGLVSIAREAADVEGERGDGLFSAAQTRRLREWIRESQGRPAQSRPARLLVATADPAALSDLANLLRPIPGIELSAEMERGRVAADEIATLGHVRIDSENAIELVHIPSLPRFAPFWSRAAHGPLGTMFLLSGSVGEASAQLQPMMDAVRGLPRSRVFHVVLLGKGDRLSADELHENLSLIDDASLFLVPLETSKDPATLLSRLFARMVP